MISEAMEIDLPYLASRDLFVQPPFTCFEIVFGGPALEIEGAMPSNQPTSDVRPNKNWEDRCWPASYLCFGGEVASQVAQVVVGTKIPATVVAVAGIAIPVTPLVFAGLGVVAIAGTVATARIIGGPLIAKIAIATAKSA